MPPGGVRCGDPATSQPVIAAYEPACNAQRGDTTGVSAYVRPSRSSWRSWTPSRTLPACASWRRSKRVRQWPNVARRSSALLSLRLSKAGLRRGAVASAPPLAGQGVVGGALSVIHARLLERPPVPEGRGKERAPVPNGVERSPEPNPRLTDLIGPLMAMIVHPYLGSAAARRELERPVPKAEGTSNGTLKDPFKDLSIRFTYRTARAGHDCRQRRGIEPLRRRQCRHQRRRPDLTPSHTLAPRGSDREPDWRPVQG